MYFYIELREIIFEIHSTLDIFKSKCISDNVYFKVSFLIPDNFFELSQFEIHEIEINIIMVTKGHKWH